MDPVVIIGTGLFGLALVVWIVCVVVAYQNAPKRGRRAAVWAVLTLFLGPLALFALYLLKPMRPAGRGGATADRYAELYQVPKKKG